MEEYSLQETCTYLLYVEECFNNKNSGIQARPGFSKDLGSRYMLQYSTLSNCVASIEVSMYDGLAFIRTTWQSVLNRMAITAAAARLVRC